MIKYNYTTRTNSDGIYIEVSKTPMIEYPTLPKDISSLNITNTDKLKELLLLENEGQQEKKLILIEEEWFDLMTNFVNFNNEKLSLEKQLSDNDDKIKNNVTEGLLTEDEITSINEDITNVNINITDSFKLVTDLEAKYKWLIEFRTSTNNTDLNTTSLRPVVKPQLTTSKKKNIIRHDVDVNIRDVNDTVADLAKMNALLMAMASGIYGTLSSTAKDKIDPTKRAIIEYAISEWDNSNTRADRQLATEGTTLIDKLFSREVKIADIVDKYK